MTTSQLLALGMPAFTAGMVGLTAILIRKPWAEPARNIASMVSKKSYWEAMNATEQTSAEIGKAERELVAAGFAAFQIAGQASAANGKDKHELASITDALTGLHNRRYMESHLGTLAEQASTSGKPLALMMLDIDNFKSINDNYGHVAGDDVLRELAVRICKLIRGIDLACRYDGEEFVIVMPETDLDVAGMFAEQLRRSIAGEPFVVNEGKKHIEVTISIGLSTLKLNGESVADALKRADTALYRAKHDGRNRVVAAAA